MHRRILLNCLVPTLLWLVAAGGVLPAAAQTPTPTITPTWTPLISYRNLLGDEPVIDGVLDDLEYGRGPMLKGLTADMARGVFPSGLNIPDATYDLYMTWSHTALYFGMRVDNDAGEDGGHNNPDPVNMVNNDSFMAFFDPNLSRDQRAQPDDFAVQFCASEEDDPVNVTRSLLSYGNGTNLQLGAATSAGEVVGVIESETFYTYEARYSLNELGLVGSEVFGDWESDNPLGDDPNWTIDFHDAVAPPEEESDSPRVVPGPDFTGELQVWDGENTTLVMHTTDLKTPFDQEGSARVFLPRPDGFRAVGITALHGAAINPAFANWNCVPAYWLVLSSNARAGGLVAGLNLTRPQPSAQSLGTFTNSPTAMVTIGANGSALLGTHALAIDDSEGNWYRLRWRKQGSLLQAKAWLDAGAEPAGWQLSVNDPAVNTIQFRDALREGWQAITTDVNRWSQLALATRRDTLPNQPAFRAAFDEIVALGAFAPQDGRTWGADFVMTDNGSEMQLHVASSNPFVRQSPGAWGRLRFEALTDFDGDGIADVIESGTDEDVVLHTHRYLIDSDGDGLHDGQEDTNFNGIVDPWETDPLNPDTDGDRLEDRFEVESWIYLLGGSCANVPHPLNPALPGDYLDRDNDGLPACLEGILSYDMNPDVDGDRFKDGYEYVNSPDPVNLRPDRNPNDRPALGDVSPDGVVTNLDALALQGFFLGALTPERRNHLNLRHNWNAGDLNRDGNISNLDALLIQAFFLGILPLLPL